MMGDIPNHEIANSAQWWKEEHDRLQTENATLKRLVEKLSNFEGDEPVKLLRLCATTMDDWSSWDNSIVRARANWLRSFASHIESLLTKETKDE